LFRKVLVVAAAMSLFGAGAVVGNAALMAPQFHDLTSRATHGAKAVMVQTKKDALTFTSTSYTNLTADTITVPATGRYLVVVRFSGESSCGATSWCTLRISVDGVEANPKVGADFAFDSPGGSTWHSLAIERVSDPIAGTGVPRAVAVAVDVAIVGSGSWRIDDWAATAELWKI